MIHELMNHGAGTYIPQFDAAIIATRGDHARIIRKLRGSYPVRMTFQCQAELTLLHIPDLNQLVIGC